MALKIIFMGTPNFAVPILEAIHQSDHKILEVYTQPATKSGRGQKINHSDIFERKGFKSVALEQIEYIAKENNPMLYKLVKMKPKWGIDISIDYVSKDAVFEVFHYEWDAFEYDAVMKMKEVIEKFVLDQDWDDVALKLWEKRDEWYHLDFFDQTKWRTDYFGLQPEKFKNVIWDN